MKYISTVSFVLVACAVFGQGRSEKRGLGYGSHSEADLEILSSGVSWIYNWYHQPETSVINVYDDYEFDYVPMAWNGSFNKEAMRTFLQNHPDVKYILGWNEPNFIDQANMTPSQAAAAWPDIEALADEFNLEIVGPAVNYCGNCVTENGTDYTDPITYLDDFFEACPDCRVDHIAIHCYMENVSALQWYVGLFKKYDRPIWLTEFAAWEGDQTLKEQKNFLIGAVDFLETDPDVFRYAWFTGRYPNQSPFIGVLKESGSLTELGEIYVNMPVHNPDAFTTVPGLIEAEAYNKMNGILLELTEDATGLANVGYIDTDDWLEYNVDVQADDGYKMLARVASINPGSITVMEGSNVLGTLNFSSTTGYQVWETYNTTINLTAGMHTLRFKANNGGFNLNWIEFEDPNVLADEKEIADIKVFPNPTSTRINIETSPRWKKLEVVDVVGKRYYQGIVQNSIQGLAAGTYFLKFVSGDGKVAVKKIIAR
jgi:hypothetical protein